jgi:hypothetical protein
VGCQLSDQVHDRFVVLMHLGAAPLDLAIDVAIDGGLRADEDANVVAVVVVVVVVVDGLGDDDASSCPSCTPTANRATVPSAVD